MRKLPTTPPPRNPNAADIIRQAAKKWPTTFVPRSKVREFTGGLYSSGYLANLDSDSKKDGPKGRFIMGRQTWYPLDSLIEWLIARLEG